MVSIPIDLIDDDPDMIQDHQFTKLYMKAQKGLIDVGMTRLPQSLINTGFYTRDAGRVQHVSQFDHSWIPGTANRIRQGERPALDVYWNQHCPGESKWVCPDDEVVLAAYRLLNIEWVPCRIYKPVEIAAEHGVIWARLDKVPTYRKSVHPIVRQHYSGLISEANLRSPEALDALVRHCEECRSEIPLFHMRSTSGIHYHQMLSAFLRRHADSLIVIRDLLGENRYEHAAAIARMAYEAYLHFYVDWLGPQFFGPRMQIYDYVRNVLRKPTTPEEAKQKADLLQKLGGFEKILESALVKGQLSPLGEQFHELTYPRLSAIAHQTYGNIERDTTEFDDLPELHEAESIKVLIRWMDVITTAIIMAVKNDTGRTIETS